MAVEFAQHPLTFAPCVRVQHPQHRLKLGHASNTP